MFECAACAWCVARSLQHNATDTKITPRSDHVVVLFTHLTILYSRHFEYDKLADEVTKTATNAALRSELALFVDHHMAASGHSAQFNSILVCSAKSCNSLSINRCSHNTIQLTPCTFSHTYRIDSAVIDYRHRSGNAQVLLI